MQSFNHHFLCSLVLITTLGCSEVRSDAASDDATTTVDPIPTSSSTTFAAESVKPEQVPKTFLKFVRDGRTGDAAKLVAFSFRQEGKYLNHKGSVDGKALEHFADLDSIVSDKVSIPDQSSFRLNGQDIYEIPVKTRTRRGYQDGYAVDKLLFMVNGNETMRLALYGDTTAEFGHLLLTVSPASLRTRRTKDNRSGRVFDQDKARELNSAAFDLYKQKRYSTALRKFEAAAEADPYFFFAPWNAACTASLLNKKEKAMELLKKAHHVDPYALSQRIHEDSDLENLRDWKPFNDWAMEHYPSDE